MRETAIARTYSGDRDYILQSSFTIEETPPGSNVFREGTTPDVGQDNVNRIRLISSADPNVQKSTIRREVSVGLSLMPSNRCFGAATLPWTNARTFWHRGVKPRTDTVWRRLQMIEAFMGNKVKTNWSNDLLIYQVPLPDVAVGDRSPCSFRDQTKPLVFDPRTVVWDSLISIKPYA